jgi:probable rRNA maturation factor
VVNFRKHVAQVTEPALSRFMDRVRKAAGLKGLVDVLLTSNAEMKVLNRRFRGKDKPTDVLSFPVADDDPREDFAGEVAISAEIAAQNARLLGHSPAEEVKILILHGILHLKGYDHERDRGQMSRRENQLRAHFRLPAGLIDRALPDDEEAENTTARRVASRTHASVARRKQADGHPRRKS